MPSLVFPIFWLRYLGERSLADISENQAHGSIINWMGSRGMDPKEDSLRKKPYN